METLLYTLLLLGSAAGAALAAVVGYMQAKLAKLDQQGVREHVANAVTKAGILITQGILTWRLAASTQQGPVFWYSWAYLLGLFATSAGLALQVRNRIADLVRAELDRADEKNGSES